MIRAVAFDLDGLMFNTEDLYDEVLSDMLQKRGHQFTRQLKLEMMGLPGVQAAGVMIQSCGLDESPEPLLREAHELLSQLLPGRLKPLPGLMTLLTLIEEQGLPKSVATSSSPGFASTALSTAGLAHRFQFVLTSEDVANGKPSPDIYLESALRHDVAPSSMLVLEDSLIGSRAGAASGAITVAIPGHHSTDQDFGHVDFRFERLDDIKLISIIENGLPG